MKQIIITSLFLLSTWAHSGSAAQQVNAASVVGGEVRPTVSVLPLSSSTVTDLHLRPMFTTTIRLPEAVTSVAVGAPTLFEVEHSDQEPRLVFVKPSTKDAATSNLIIALQSGHEISIQLLSEGAAGTTPVDFVVNYQPQQSFLIGSADPVVNQEEAIAKTSSKQKEIPVIDLALEREANVATPDWAPGAGNRSRNPDAREPGKPMLAALGDVRAYGDEMLVAYSVLNTTDHWIEVLPPQVEINSPDQELAKKKDKKQGRQILAEEVAVTDYRLNATRLAPGERADGAVQFSRPGFKQSKDRLVLELATASEVDNPVRLPVPFVAPAAR
jgi:hypothetical protein